VSGRLLRHDGPEDQYRRHSPDELRQSVHRNAPSRRGVIAAPEIKTTVYFLEFPRADSPIRW
jgi:hypothetical protein